MAREVWRTTIALNVKEVIQKVVRAQLGYASPGDIVQAAVDSYRLAGPGQPANEQFVVSQADREIRRARGTVSFTCTVRADVKSRVVACINHEKRLSVPLVLEEVVCAFFKKNVRKLSISDSINTLFAQTIEPTDSDSERAKTLGREVDVPGKKALVSEATSND